MNYYNGTQFTWEMGRQLASAELANGTEISYKYNADGLRTEKTIGNTTTSYTLIGSKITGQSDGTNTFYFRYDDSDNLVGFELNGIQYFYVTNLVGDIIAILDSNGSAVVEYEYDPWGLCTIVSDTTNNNLGTLNPFRYRGYYYDEDTGLYYLQSRYYDPVTMKFINADDPAIILLIPYQMTSVLSYDYCQGNPVVNSDYNGLWSRVAYKKTNNSVSIKIKIPWNDVRNFLSSYSLALTIAGIIACFIPEPIISKAVGLALGVTGIIVFIANSIIEKKKAGKTIYLYLYFNYKIYVYRKYIRIINSKIAKIGYWKTYKQAKIYNIKWVVYL